VSGDGGGFVLSGLSEGEGVLSALSSAGRGQARVYAFDNASSEVTIEITEVPGGAARGGGVGQTKKTERGATGSLRGRVVHISTGKPVADAAISVVHGAGPVPDIAPLTDSSGWFALDGLPAGDWLLRALGPSGETGEATVCVSAGRVAEMVIKTGA